MVAGQALCEAIAGGPNEVWGLTSEGPSRKAIDPLWLSDTPGGGGTHYMKVTTYAPPFRPPFFRYLENLYSFDRYILAKMSKMSYFDPYFLSKLGKMYSFDPPFWPL